MSASSAPPITYQGYLSFEGAPLDDICDVRATLWDAASGGSVIGSPIEQMNAAVNAGRFALELDFGPGAFDGADRWLELGVRHPTGSGDYATLAPRRVTARKRRVP